MGVATQERVGIAAGIITIRFVVQLVRLVIIRSELIVAGREDLFLFLVVLVIVDRVGTLVLVVLIFV